MFLSFSLFFFFSSFFFIVVLLVVVLLLVVVVAVGGVGGVGVVGVVFFCALDVEVVVCSVAVGVRLFFAAAAFVLVMTSVFFCTFSLFLSFLFINCSNLRFMHSELLV